MTLINPFVPFTDLEPLEYRREPLGEKGGIFFYNIDDEHAHKYTRCGGAVYPEAAIATVAECAVVGANNSTNSAPSAAAASSSSLIRDGQLTVINNHKRQRLADNDEDAAYAPTLTTALKTIINYVPALSYFTYSTDTAAQLAKTPGNFFFRLSKTSPHYRNFTASKFSAQAIAFHPYFPIIAVAEQRTPMECAIIRFYDVANSSFIDDLVLMHPQMRGVTELCWKPHSRDVLAVGVFGGVMMWSIHGLIGAMEGHVAAKANGRISLLRGGSATAPRRGQRSLTAGLSTSITQQQGMNNTFLSGNNNNETDSVITSSTANPATRNATNATALMRSTAVGSQFSAPKLDRTNNADNDNANITAHKNTTATNSSVKKRPLNELTHILGATPSAKAAAAGFGSVNWSAAHNGSGRNVDQSAVFAAANGMDTTMSRAASTAAGAASSSSFVAGNLNTPFKGPTAHFITYGFTSRSIPITAIAFSEVSGALMAIASRGSPDTCLHNISSRPTESLLATLPNYNVGVVSNVSCLVFSMDDKFLFRGYEDSNRLSITNVSTLQSKHFVTPAPILKMVRVEVLGFNVFALLLKDTEAVTIAHISEDAITILANVVTGQHGVGAIGGQVLDIACSSYNLYVRVTSGHVLVMGVTGGSASSSVLMSGGGGNLSSLLAASANDDNTNNADKRTGLACSQIGVYLKGGIPVAFGNQQIVKMDTFPSFVNGALLAVADAERGTIRMVPSYFTRGVESV